MITFERTIIDSNSVVFSGIEDESVIGKCTLKISVPYADVFSITCSDNKTYIIEGLIKSALFYASQKDCYIARCKCEGFEGFVEKMNFIKSDNGYENDIPTILMGSCSGCKNNI